MVFQSYALFPNLTVRQNVAFPLDVRRWQRDRVRARVDELLKLVRLEPEADRYPNQISGGQAQRCALARALAPDPEVLLLDEPLSALDVLVRTHLRDEIRRVQQAVGTTTIYVTHDQSEALAIADRVAVMNHGRIEQIGSAMEIYAAPTTRFSASFVGNRNAVEVPVRNRRAVLGQLFEVEAPPEANGRVLAYFAPEDVRIHASGEDGHLATIASRTFHGATTRLHLRLETDATPAIDLYADVATREAVLLDIDRPVRLTIDPVHVSCFAPESSALE
jgi:putative spermidine/putrescine transport system ATP-binding protein